MYSLSHHTAIAHHSHHFPLPLRHPHNMSTLPRRSSSAIHKHARSSIASPRIPRASTYPSLHALSHSAETSPDPHFLHTTNNEHLATPHHTHTSLSSPAPSPQLRQQYTPSPDLQKFSRTSADYVTTPSPEASTHFEHLAASPQHLTSHPAPRPHPRMHTPHTPTNRHTQGVTMSAPSTRRCRNSPSSNFRCNICNQRYSRKDNLRVHQRVHSGEKPYKCDHCGLRFRWLGALRNHTDSSRCRSSPDGLSAASTSQDSLVVVGGADFMVAQAPPAVVNGGVEDAQVMDSGNRNAGAFAPPMAVKNEVGASEWVSQDRVAGGRCLEERSAKLTTNNLVHFVEGTHSANSQVDNRIIPSTVGSADIDSSAADVMNNIFNLTEDINPPDLDRFATMLDDDLSLDFS